MHCKSGSRRLALIATVFQLAAHSGCSRESPEPTRRSSEQNGTRHEIHVDVTEKGFDPALQIVSRGEPVTVVMTRKTNKTCATSVIFPNAKNYQLPLNQPIRIDLSASRGDTLEYVC